MGAKKDKKQKAQVMTLSDFVGESAAGKTTGESLDWAMDVDYDEEETNEVGKPRISYARTAGAMSNFRDESNRVSNSRIVDYNMERPYLGFVANLLTNLPEPELRAFFDDANLACENIKMIYKERSTFAFVEFETPQALQLALLLQGKFLKGRQVKVDIATQDQREKMMNDKARGMLGGRDGPKSPNSQFPDRDAMGSEQRSFNSMGERRGPRSNTSANPPRDFSDFSRDTMGGTQPEMSNEFGSRNSRTPNSSTPSAGGFPNFRDTDRVEQPTMARVGSRDGGNWRGSKAGSPTTKTEGGSWRDSAKTEQPAGSWRDQPTTAQPSGERSAPQRPKSEEKAAPATKAPAKTLQLGGEAQPQPKKDMSVPKPAAAPKVSAWGADKLAFRNSE